jgi:hypothetical protein
MKPEIRLEHSPRLKIYLLRRGCCGQLRTIAGLLRTVVMLLEAIAVLLRTVKTPVFLWHFATFRVLPKTIEDWIVYQCLLQLFASFWASTKLRNSATNVRYTTQSSESGSGAPPKQPRKAKGTRACCPNAGLSESPVYKGQRCHTSYVPQPHLRGADMPLIRTQGSSGFPLSRANTPTRNSGDRS